MSDRRSSRIVTPVARDSLKPGNKLGMSLKSNASLPPPNAASSSAQNNTDLITNEKSRDNQLKDLVTNWMAIGNDDFLPVVRAAFDWVSHKRAMIKTKTVTDGALSPSPRSSEDGEGEGAEGDEKSQEAETRANVESVMQVLEGLIGERDREIEQLCSSQYSELVSAVEALSHVRHGANEVAGAVQSLALDLKKEGEGLVTSVERLNETQELVQNVSGARAAVQASLQALQLLAEAHGLCEEGKLYQALRAVDIIRTRYLVQEEGGARAALAAMQRQGRQAGAGSSSASAPPAAAAPPQTESTLVASFGPLRRVLQREVQRIVEEVDRQSLAGFHEWLVVARREARAIGGLAMQHELEAMDEEDRLLLGQEALKAMLAVGEGPRDISKRLVSAGLVDQPPEDAFLPTLRGETDSGDEEERGPAGALTSPKGASSAFLAGSKVLGRLDLTPLHRTLEIQRRLGKEAWFREYYLSNRRQQLVIDFKPSSESKQKEVATSFIMRPQEYMASLVGFFVVERGVHLATHGAVTDPQETASLFASMVPTLVELLSQALDKAAGAALRTPGMEEEAETDEPVIVSAPQLLMVKSQIHVACDALSKRGLDTTELLEVLWNYRKKFLEIVLKGAVEELKEKLFEPPPPGPEPRPEGEEEMAREPPAPLPRWLERHKVTSRDAEEEEHGTLGLPKPWLLKDGLDDGARNLAQAFTRFGGSAEQRRFVSQAVLQGLSKATRDAGRFPYQAPYSEYVPEVIRVVRRAVNESATFFRGLVGRADVAALTRDFFLTRVLVRVVRDPIREFIQTAENITWAIQLSADCSAILHSITALEEYVLLTGKGVTAARMTRDNAAMLSLQRHRAPAPFTSRFVRLEEYAAKAAINDAIMIAEGIPHNTAAQQAGSLFRNSGQVGSAGSSMHGTPLARPSMGGAASAVNRMQANRYVFRGTVLGSVKHATDEAEHSDAWRTLIGLATDILSTTVERLVAVAAVRVKKVCTVEKYWYEEVYTDRPPPKKDWRGNLLPMPPCPFNAPAPPQIDLNQPPYPEPLLWPQEVEADLRDFLKQCVELLPPEQCLQAHWRVFRGIIEQVFVGWRNPEVSRWSHYGIRRLHSDLSVLEAMADRCQLDMIASGVFDKLGLTPRSGDDDHVGLSISNPARQSISRFSSATLPGPGGPGGGPDSVSQTFDLKDAMIEARQVIHLALSCKPEAILDPHLRRTQYSRIDLMGLYFLLDKYREPPGSTLSEMKAKFGNKDARVSYFKRKDAETLQKSLMAQVKEKGERARKELEEEERLAQGIFDASALPSITAQGAPASGPAAGLARKSGLSSASTLPVAIEAPEEGEDPEEGPGHGEDGAAAPAAAQDNGAHDSTSADSGPAADDKAAEPAKKKKGWF